MGGRDVWWWGWGKKFSDYYVVLVESGNIRSGIFRGVLMFCRGLSN